MLSAAPQLQTRLAHADIDPAGLPLSRRPDEVRLERRRRSANHEQELHPVQRRRLGAVFAEPLPAPAKALWDAAADNAAGAEPPAAIDVESAPPRAACVALDDAALAALIDRVVERDEKALETLYDATCRRVHGLVLQIVQRCALADEVVEDTYWQVWRQAPRFDPARGRPLTRLLAMARSRAIDALRHPEQTLPPRRVARGGRRRRHRGGPPPPPDWSTRRAARRRCTRHYARSTRGPPARLAGVLPRPHARGSRTGEALPLGTVKSQIRRALQHLKRVLQAPGTGRGDA